MWKLGNICYNRLFQNFEGNYFGLRRKHTCFTSPNRNPPGSQKGEARINILKVGWLNPCLDHCFGLVGEK